MPSLSLLRGLCLTLILLSSSAWSYTFLYLTDEPGMAHAQAYAEFIKTVKPFSDFEIEHQFELVPQELLKCHQSSEVARITTCDQNYMQARLKELKAKDPSSSHRVIVFTGQGHGATGLSDLGAVVSYKGSSKQVFLHELMHSYNFADEYYFPPNEEKIYCHQIFLARAHNLIFVPESEAQYVYQKRTWSRRELGFQTNEDALAALESKIFWADQIRNPIVREEEAGTMVLGSNENEAGLDRAGIYRAKNCDTVRDNHGQRIPGRLYRAVGVDNIMKNNRAPIGTVYEKMLERILIEEGAVRK